MESTVLTVKFVMFLAMELFVFGTLTAALIVGIWEAVQARLQRRAEFPAGRMHLPTRAS